MDGIDVAKGECLVYSVGVAGNKHLDISTRLSYVMVMVYTQSCIHIIHIHSQYSHIDHRIMTYSNPSSCFPSISPVLLLCSVSSFTLLIFCSRSPNFLHFLLLCILSPGHYQFDKAMGALGCEVHLRKTHFMSS